MACSPGQYRWLSYRCNGQGNKDELVTPHLIFKAPSKTQFARLEAYKALFKARLDKGVLNDICSAWEAGTSLGNNHFRQKIEVKLKCQVGQARRGRPEKTKDADL